MLQELAWIVMGVWGAVKVFGIVMTRWEELTSGYWRRQHDRTLDELEKANEKLGEAESEIHDLREELADLRNEHNIVVRSFLTEPSQAAEFNKSDWLPAEIEVVDLDEEEAPKPAKRKYTSRLDPKLDKRTKAYREAMAKKKKK